MDWSRLRELLAVMQKNLECSICLDLLKKPMLTRCNHQFCNFCISEFFKNKTSVLCPLCKSPITKRSLRENSKLGRIVEGLRNLIAAIHEDSGWQYTPPDGSLSVDCHACTSGSLNTNKREIGLKRKITLSEDKPETNKRKQNNIRYAKKREFVLPDGNSFNSPVDTQTEDQSLSESGRLACDSCQGATTDQKVETAGMPDCGEPENNGSMPWTECQERQNDKFRIAQFKTTVDVQKAFGDLKRTLCDENKTLSTSPDHFDLIDLVSVAGSFDKYKDETSSHGHQDKGENVIVNISAERYKPSQDGGSRMVEQRKEMDTFFFHDDRSFNAKGIQMDATQQMDSKESSNAADVDKRSPAVSQFVSKTKIPVQRIKPKSVNHIASQQCIRERQGFDVSVSQQSLYTSSYVTYHQSKLENTVRTYSKMNLPGNRKGQGRNKSKRESAKNWKQSLPGRFRASCNKEGECRSTVAITNPATISNQAQTGTCHKVSHKNWNPGEELRNDPFKFENSQEMSKQKSGKHMVALDDQLNNNSFKRINPQRQKAATEENLNEALCDKGMQAADSEEANFLPVNYTKKNKGVQIKMKTPTCAKVQRRRRRQSKLVLDNEKKEEEEKEIAKLVHKLNQAEEYSLLFCSQDVQATLGSGEMIMIDEGEQPHKEVSKRSIGAADDGDISRVVHLKEPVENRMLDTNSSSKIKTDEGSKDNILNPGLKTVDCTAEECSLISKSVEAQNEIPEGKRKMLRSDDVHLKVSELGQGENSKPNHTSSVRLEEAVTTSRLKPVVVESEKTALKETTKDIGGTDFNGSLLQSSDGIGTAEGKSFRAHAGMETLTEDTFQTFGENNIDEWSHSKLEDSPTVDKPDIYDVIGLRRVTDNPGLDTDEVNSSSTEDLNINPRDSEYEVSNEGSMNVTGPLHLDSGHDDDKNEVSSTSTEDLNIHPDDTEYEIPDEAVWPVLQKQLSAKICNWKVKERIKRREKPAKRICHPKNEEKRESSSKTCKMSREQLTKICQKKDSGTCAKSLNPAHSSQNKSREQFSPKPVAEVLDREGAKRHGMALRNIKRKARHNLKTVNFVGSEATVSKNRQVNCEIVNSSGRTAGIIKETQFSSSSDFIQGSLSPRTISVSEKTKPFSQLPNSAAEGSINTTLDVSKQFACRHSIPESQISMSPCQPLEYSECLTGSMSGERKAEHLGVVTSELLGMHMSESPTVSICGELKTHSSDLELPRMTTLEAKDASGIPMDIIEGLQDSNEMDSRLSLDSKEFQMLECKKKRLCRSEKADVANESQNKPVFQSLENPSVLMVAESQEEQQSKMPTPVVVKETQPLLGMDKVAGNHDFNVTRNVDENSALVGLSEILACSKTVKNPICNPLATRNLESNPVDLVSVLPEKSLHKDTKEKIHDNVKGSITITDEEASVLNSESAVIITTDREGKVQKPLSKSQSRTDSGIISQESQKLGILSLMLPSDVVSSSNRHLNKTECKSFDVNGKTPLPCTSSEETKPNLSVEETGLSSSKGTFNLHRKKEATDLESFQVRRSKRKCFSLDGSPLKIPLAKRLNQSARADLLSCNVKPPLGADGATGPTVAGNDSAVLSHENMQTISLPGIKLPDYKWSEVDIHNGVNVSESWSQQTLPPEDDEVAGGTCGETTEVTEPIHRALGLSLPLKLIVCEEYSSESKPCGQYSNEELGINNVQLSIKTSGCFGSPKELKVSDSLIQSSQRGFECLTSDPQRIALGLSDKDPKPAIREIVSVGCAEESPQHSFDEMPIADTEPSNDLRHPPYSMTLTPSKKTCRGELEITGIEETIESKKPSSTQCKCITTPKNRFENTVNMLAEDGELKCLMLPLPHESASEEPLLHKMQDAKVQSPDSDSLDITQKPSVDVEFLDSNVGGSEQNLLSGINSSSQYIGTKSQSILPQQTVPWQCKEGPYCRDVLKTADAKDCHSLYEREFKKEMKEISQDCFPKEQQKNDSSDSNSSLSDLLLHHLEENSGMKIDKGQETLRTSDCMSELVTTADSEPEILAEEKLHTMGNGDKNTENNGVMVSTQGEKVKAGALNSTRSADLIEDDDGLMLEEKFANMESDCEESQGAPSSQNSMQGPPGTYLTSSSAFSSQSENLDTQQQKVLVHDLVEMKAAIAQLEAEIAQKDAEKLQSSEEAEVAGDDDSEKVSETGADKTGIRCCQSPIAANMDIVPDSLPDQDPTKQGDKQVVPIYDCSSGNESDDLFLTPKSPTSPPPPPPPLLESELNKQLAIPTEFEGPDKFKSPNMAACNRKLCHRDPANRSFDSPQPAPMVNNGEPAQKVFLSPMFRNSSSSRISLYGSAALRESPIQHNSLGRRRLTGSKCFIATGLTTLEVREVQQLAEQCGAKFCLKFNRSVTHVIIQTVDEDTRCCERTLKYFQGIANGCWILSFCWVRDSVADGKCLPEDPYEIQGDVVSGKNHRGPERSRLAKFLLFSSYEVVCMGESRELKLSELKEMLELGGASVFSVPNLFSFLPKKKRLIVVGEDVGAISGNKYNKFYQTFGILTICREWVLDSIAQYRIQPLDAYILSMDITNFNER